MLRGVVWNFSVLVIDGLVAVPGNPDGSRDSEDSGDPVEGNGVTTDVVLQQT